ALVGLRPRSLDPLDLRAAALRAFRCLRIRARHVAILALPEDLVRLHGLLRTAFRTALVLDRHGIRANLAEQIRLGLEDAPDVVNVDQKAAVFHLVRDLTRELSNHMGVAPGRRRTPPSR